MKSFVLAVAVVSATSSLFAADAAFPPNAPDAARVAEIAAALPEKAGMVGFRPEDRPRWLELGKTKQAKSIVNNAVKIVAEPIPDVPDEWYLDFTRNGNRTRYQGPYFKRMKNLEWLACAEGFEQKGRFLPKIADYVEAIMAERSWVMPAHDPKLRAFKGELHFIDLGCGHQLVAMAGVYALFRDKLPADLVARMVPEMRRRGLDNYLKVADHAGLRGKLGMGWFYGNANWNAVCNSCIVRAFLNAVDDRTDRARALEAAERASRRYLSGFTPDGYCSEGTGYWSYGYGNYLYMGLAARAATGGVVDLFKDPINRVTVERYAYGARLEKGKGLPFADGTSAIGPTFFALSRQVWPDLVCTEALKDNFIHADFNQFPLRAFGQEPAAAAPTMDDLPARSFFPDAQVFVMRAPWKGEAPAFSFAVKGGHNAEMHNHNDVGSYTVMLGSVQMAGDPEGEVYTRFTFSPRRYESKMLNSWGHPVPVLGGALQAPGRAAAAKVLSVETNDAVDSVVVDFAAAYPACSNVTALVRSVTFDREKRTVRVEDRASFKTPTAFETPVVTYSDVVTDYTPNHFTLTRGKRTMDVDVAVEGGAWTWKTDLVPNPTKIAASRLAVAFDAPVTNVVVAVTYTAR